MPTIRSATRPLALLLSALLAQSALAQAAPPLTDTSVDALVAALRSGPPTKSFRRTQLPDSGNNLCAAAPAAAGSERLGRNLEVVPYAGDSTPGVNLSVQFATGSDRLTPGDRALLDRLAQALQAPALAQERFAVAGHTDQTGDARINFELSCARALAVRQYLGSRGVAPQRLSAYGFGSVRLLAADDPTGGVNRRVEIRKAPE
jgi:outer membrane protein OmpA-like peptidoglycan-associated protein